MDVNMPEGSRVKAKVDLKIFDDDDEVIKCVPKGTIGYVLREPFSIDPSGKMLIDFGHFGLWNVFYDKIEARDDS